MKSEEIKERDPWCGRCVYRTGILGQCGPCVREGEEQRLCIVRILIAELDMKTRKIRRNNK